jgi:hypothetical protein
MKKLFNWFKPSFFYLGKHMKTFIALLLISNTVFAASLYAPNGTYLGEVGGNPYGKNNIDNPASYYNNSGMSINSHNGMYGNEYSQQSPNNPMVIHSTPTFRDETPLPASEPIVIEPMTLPPCKTCGANFQEIPW